MRGTRPHLRFSRCTLWFPTTARHYFHISTMAEATLAKDAPWYAAYPEARSSPVTITRANLLDMIETGKRSGVDFILIDLRRADHEVSNAYAKARRHADQCTSKREELYRVRSIFPLRACTQPYQHCMLFSKLLGSPRLFGIAVSTPHELKQRRVHAH